MKVFQRVNVANAGNRGRPPLPREHDFVHEAILNHRGDELGELMIEPQENGSVLLTAVVGNRKRTVEFPAPASKPRKARKATAKAA